MPEGKPPKFLYHYTTIKSLPYIFKENGKVEFRFTDYRFLNDAEEGTFLKKFIEKNKADYRKSLKEQDLKKLFDLFADRFSRLEDRLRQNNYTPYIMSFTKCEDSMQFWRQDYAKDKGICLKLSTSKFKFSTEYDGTDFEPKYPTFSQVRYISSSDTIGKAFPKLKKDLSNFLKSKKGNCFDKLVFTKDFQPKIKVFSVKNKVWMSEDEWRLKIVRLGEDSTLHSIKAEYKTDELGIPRATIEIKNPIEEIILGPTFSPQYVDSIKEWLNNRHFNDINVRCGDGVLNW